MSFAQRTVAHCDQCGHEWIIVRKPLQKSWTSTKLPSHCAKCKSRQWNAGEKKKYKPA